MAILSYIYPIRGEIFALTSAALWAFAAIFYRKLGDSVSPLGMSLGKSVVALICLGALLLLSDTSLVSRKAFLFLGISGLLGIALGDTLFFVALLKLGPRLTLLSTTLIPVITFFLAVLFLHEYPSTISWIGIFCTILGVFWVLWERTSKESLAHDLKKGIIYAVLSALCCAVGIIFCKVGIESISALQATFIRQGCGMIGLLFLGIVSFRLKDWLRPLTNPMVLKKMVLVAFIGTFLGTWFCLLALKYMDAAIATTLNSTSPIFVLPLAFIFMKERITLRAIIGSVIAVVGTGLIFIG